MGTEVDEINEVFEKDVVAKTVKEDKKRVTYEPAEIDYSVWQLPRMV